MQEELNAGATYVIAEAREAGNLGIYRSSGEVREGLVNEILTKVPGEKIIWEAPQKNQQLFFLELLSVDVNLGNSSPNEVIALEAMRIGLRGDSFHLFLNGKQAYEVLKKFLIHKIRPSTKQDRSVPNVFKTSYI